MKTKHTPGPWVISNQPKSFGVGPESQPIVRVYFQPCDNRIPLDKESAMADARLIAAAPELLESLEGIMDRPDFDWNIARAAIAKAKGETP